MSLYPSYNPALQPDEDQETLTIEQHPYSLVVWNDEVNTFEWVIETLIEICKHSQEQAEQCAFLIHNKGKYAVKNGSYETLKPQCDAITDRAIGATLEVMV
ncbi:MAG: ATP-dependent Clp protease adaptor ClpS [Ferruginibacter sp.]